MEGKPRLALKQCCIAPRGSMHHWEQIHWIRLVSIFGVLLFLFTNCTDPDDEINYDIIDPLEAVIQSDLIAFDGMTPPREVLDTIASFKAVAFGEMHTILEERELIAHLAIQLNTIQVPVSICAECPQAYSWIYNHLSTSPLDTVPAWASYSKLNPILDSLRRHNVENSDPITLNCIDANLQGSSFLSSLKGYADYIGVNQVFSEFSQAFPASHSDTYIKNLEALELILEMTPEALNFSMNDKSIEILTHLVENELGSVGIRATWDSDYTQSSANREGLIKNNADRFLSASSNLILFYFGAYHVQKGIFLGSPQEWLGDYLHHVNEISRGNSISIVGVPLTGEIFNPQKGSTFRFDLSRDSKEDDLFRILSSAQSASFAWLPLSDPIFSDEDIRANYIFEGAEVIGPPKQQFDAFISFSSGTFVGY